MSLRAIHSRLERQRNALRGGLSGNATAAQRIPSLGSPDYPAYVDRSRRVAWRWLRRYGVRAVAGRIFTAWAVYEAAQVVQTIWQTWPSGTGWRLQVVCIPPFRPCPLPNQAIYYSGNLFLGCLTAQAISGGSSSDIYGATARKHLWSVYDSGCVGVVRGDEIMRWNRTTTNDGRRVLPLPVPHKDVVRPVPPSMAPREQAKYGVAPWNPARPAFRAVPRLVPLPLTAQTRSSANAAPWDDPRKNVIVRPFVRTITVDADGRTTDRRRVLTRDIPRAVPRATPARKEAKVEPNRNSRALWRTAGMASEAYDFVDVLYQSLPQHLRGNASSTYDKVIAIVRYWQYIDPVSFLGNLAMNEIGDLATGTRIGRSRELTDAMDPSGNLWRGVATFDGAVGTAQSWIN